MCIRDRLRLMSAIIYSEAGAECFAGKKAVGIVIMNRVKSKSYPNSLNGVVYQPYQFGPVTVSYTHLTTSPLYKTTD